jgi:hypothetical protein
VPAASRVPARGGGAAGTTSPRETPPGCAGARERRRRRSTGPSRPAENGRAAHNGSHRERAPSDDEWLLAAGFAMLDEHGRLVATDAGLDAGSALGDPRVFA